MSGFVGEDSNVRSCAFATGFSIVVRAGTGAARSGRAVTLGLGGAASFGLLSEDAIQIKPRPTDRRKDRLLQNGEFGRGAVGRVVCCARGFRGGACRSGLDGDVRRGGG